MQEVLALIPICRQCGNPIVGVNRISRILNSFHKDIDKYYTQHGYEQMFIITKHAHTYNQDNTMIIKSRVQEGNIYNSSATYAYAYF